MRTLEEYVAMIPTAPPDDIERYLDALGRKPFAVTSYRCISRDDAESRLDCEDFRADLRPSAAIRPAALWCSECESWYLADAVQQTGETEKAGKFRAALYKALLALADEANGVQR